jgi:cell division protein ZapA (FtsZ GTPase activity inhibitor)
MEVKVAKVTVQEREFHLRTAGDVSELEAAAELLNRKLVQMASKTTQPPHSVALLVGLDLAAELLRERAKQAELREKIRDQSRWMLDRLDAGESASTFGDSPLEVEG